MQHNLFKILIISLAFLSLQRLSCRKDIPKGQEILRRPGLLWIQDRHSKPKYGGYNLYF